MGIGQRFQRNALGANVTLDEDGNGWMVFGSFWSGIKITRLDSTLTRLSAPQVWHPVCSRPRGMHNAGGNGAVEAPFIIKRGEWYYLFVSFDYCCRGEKSNYNVVAGRSKSICGPYSDKDGVSMMRGGGTTVVKGNEQYPGVGHCAVACLDGKDYIFMYGYDKNENYVSKLVIRGLDWSEDGWPSAKL